LIQTIDREYELPIKILELNPRHPLLHNLNNMLANHGDDALIDAVVEQVFETALLQDGIHPDPAAMASRLTLLMQAATGSTTAELDFSDTLSVQEPPPAPEMPDMPGMNFGPDIVDADFVDIDDNIAEEDEENKDK